MLTCSYAVKVSKRGHATQSRGRKKQTGRTGGRGTCLICDLTYLSCAVLLITTTILT